MNCKDCKGVPDSVSRWEHENDVSRQEITIKRLVIAVIVMAVALTVSAGAALGIAYFGFRTNEKNNAAWLEAWQAYDYTSEDKVYTYQQDGNGVNIVGSSNEVNNGAESNDP